MASDKYLTTTPGTMIEFRITRPPWWAWLWARVSHRRLCRVYWGHAGCERRRGHRGQHRDLPGHAPFDPAYAFGEDWDD